MGDDGTEVLDDDAYVETFLDVESVKVFAFESDGSVHGLLQNLFAILDLFSIACECDFALLKTPVQLVRLRSKVLDNVVQSFRRYRPVVGGGLRVKACTEDFAALVVEAILLEHALLTNQVEDKTALRLVGPSL